MTTPIEPPAASKKRISGAWYALVALPGLFAIATLYINVPKVIHALTHLRLATFDAGMAHDVDLRPGENTIYVEGERHGENTVALTSLDCTLRDQTRALVLEPVTGTETYTVGGFTGVAQFNVTIPTAGSYTITCTSGSPAQFSIGIGFPFMTVIWCVLALFLAMPLTGVIGYLVHRVRNGKRPGARIT
jgi:hypothetical protein